MQRDPPHHHLRCDIAIPTCQQSCIIFEFLQIISAVQHLIVLCGLSGHNGLLQRQEEARPLPARFLQIVGYPMN